MSRRGQYRTQPRRTARATTRARRRCCLPTPSHLRLTDLLISVSMEMLKEKNPEVLMVMRCLNLVLDAYILMTRIYSTKLFSNPGKWIVKGGGNTNPVNNHHTQIKNSEAVTDPTSANAKNTIPLDMGSEDPVLAELHTYRSTLENWKCYLDSCTTYHNFFFREFLYRVSLVKTDMNGRCNASTVTTNTKGLYGEFKVWLNERGIANLLYILMIEDTWYIVSTHTKGDWVLTSPKGKKIFSKRIQEYARGCHTSICVRTRKVSA